MTESHLYTSGPIQLDLQKVEWDFLSTSFQSWSAFKDIVAAHTVLTSGRHAADAKEDTRWKQLVLEVVDRLSDEAAAQERTSPFASRYVLKDLIEGRAVDGFAEAMARVMGLEPESSLAKAMRHAELMAFSSAKPYYANGSVASGTEDSATTTTTNGAAALAPTGGPSQSKREQRHVPKGDEVEPNRPAIGPAAERQTYARKLAPPFDPTREQGVGETSFDLIHRLAEEARRLQVTGETAATRVVKRREVDDTDLGV